MKEDNRCSILFHLLVPGGKWQTEMERPVLSASVCSSTFHSRSRDPLLPPPSAVISRPFATGWGRRPSCRHQPRMHATAFFVSTEMTGVPFAKARLTCLLIWRNWASRSVCSCRSSAAATRDRPASPGRSGVSGRPSRGDRGRWLFATGRTINSPAESSRGPGCRLRWRP